jgi:glycosyltransferase involved in cell wall biosynthesis
MAHGLAAAGHRVTVISLAPGGEETVVRAGGVEVHRVRPSPNWDRWRVLWRLNRYWPGFAWAAARRLKAVHAAARVDVVETAENRADGLFIPLLRRRPRSVVRLHTPWAVVDRLNRVTPDRPRRWVYRQEALAIRTADVVTAPSRAVVDVTAECAPVRPGEVRVIPNPVDVGRYSPVEGPRADEVLVVGRLEERKGAGLLAEAMPDVLRRCPGSSFRFVGSDGADAAGRSWRERLAAGVPAADRARVHFEQVPRDVLLGRYRRAAVSVLPSVWENFPYALLEGMACGTPAVGTRTGGLPELIEDGVSGLIVPPADAAALADGLCRLLRDAGLRDRMGRAARARCLDRFSLDRVIPDMIDVYRAA